MKVNANARDYFVAPDINAALMQEEERPASILARIPAARWEGGRKEQEDF